MAKGKNILESKELRVTVAPEMYEDLENLVRAARGKYGKNPTEAGERLIAERLIELAREGLLLPPPKPVRPRE